MKKIIIFLLGISGLVARGQDPSVSQVIMEESNNGIYSGTFNENGKIVNSFTIVYNGDILDFFKELKKDFGREEIIFENLTSSLSFRILVFKNVKKSDWSEEKIIVKLSSTSNGTRHLITITCFDKKGSDLLQPDAETQEKIRQFLESKL